MIQKLISIQSVTIACGAQRWYNLVIPHKGRLQKIVFIYRNRMHDHFIRPNIPLRDHTSIKVGGNAAYFSEVDTVEDLLFLVDWANQEKVPFFVLGGGTNLIFSDKGYEGLVIKVTGKKFSLLPGNRIVAEAGASMADLVEFAVQHNLSGLEWAGGLPGTVGGAIRGNAGAFGGEMKDAITRVAVLAPDTNQVEILSGDKSKFSYRNSIFKEQGGIVLSAELQLTPADDPEKIKSLTEEKIAYRQTFHPMEYPNAGSFFKNINNPQAIERILYRDNFLREDVEKKWHHKIPVAVLIAELGLSGKKIGGAEVSRKHANFIVNAKGASAEDIVITSGIIKNKMQSIYGILLEEEVEFTGF